MSALNKVPGNGRCKQRVWVYVLVTDVRHSRWWRGVLGTLLIVGLFIHVSVERWGSWGEADNEANTNDLNVGPFFFSSHLLNVHLKLSELTVAFAGSFGPFKGVSYSVVESLTSEYEEENQTQLKAKGQHAQHHYGVNCWRYGKQHAFQKTLLWIQIGLKTMFETFPSVTTCRLLCRCLPVGDLRLGQAQSQVFFLELFHPSGSSCSQITGTTQHRTNSDLLRTFPANS